MVNKQKVKELTKKYLDFEKENGIGYAKNREDRKKDTGEVFTPLELVFEMLDKLDYDWNTLPDKTFLDPTCGNGQFLVGIAIRGVHPKNIYGVDLMEDNVKITKHRLRDIYQEHGYSDEEIQKYLDKNIVQADALTYDYNFGEEKFEEW